MPKWLQIIAMLNQLVPNELTLVAQVVATIHGQHIAAGQAGVDMTAIAKQTAASIAPTT